MKIVFISTQVTPPWGGGEELWSDTALHALAMGHHVAAWVSERPTKHPKLIQLEQNGATVHYWPTRSPASSLKQRIFRRVGFGQQSNTWGLERWGAAQAILPFVPDAICVSQGGTYCTLQTEGLGEWLLAQPSPFLFICHSNREWARPAGDGRGRAGQLFAKASSLCFVAQANLEAARRFLAADLPQARVVQNPVNLSDQSLVAWPATTVPRFATVARIISRDKGQDLLIEALARPEWRNRDFHLDFFGTGPDEEYLSELITHHHLGDRVRLCGHEGDLRKIWSSHQMLVLPSLSEGTPLSLIEAQLCGRPALVTRVDGNPEWVEEDVSGFIAEAPTVHHLAIALERAWQATDRWQEMGAAARTRCLANRDPDPADALLKLIETAGNASPTIDA